jgi:hypothetical protein
MIRALSICIVSILVGCVPSIDYTNRKEAVNIAKQCFELQKTSFIYEGRCADLTGVNNNSEFCYSIQALGENKFPSSWSSYIQNRKSFDEKTFNRLLFEKQRTMVGVIDKGTKLYINRFVYHAWGVDGFYWVARAVLKYKDDAVEVELPSIGRIHVKPLWLDGSSKEVPTIDPKYLQQCL